MKSSFDSSAWGPLPLALVGEAQRLMPLGPGNPDPSIRERLSQFQPLTDWGKPVRHPSFARAAHAGLWLYHDFLDESHSISQELEDATGSFWHAIMHRREPDAFNSKYWWRRVAAHPVLAELVRQAPALGYIYTTPFDFVDFCERVRGTGGVEELLAQRVQLLEWQRLMIFCWQEL
jgi:hypothetical protein